MQSPPLPSRFDPDRLRRLLDLVGPTEADSFLAQLDRDLSGCARNIARATDRQDWIMLREASHVLISLAGSAGAVALQSLAEDLNAAANARNLTSAAELATALAPDLDRLIAVVRTMPNPFTSPG
jgi:two-component system aerobic respiration control sensor histidine kinase ArcB